MAGPWEDFAPSQDSDTQAGPWQDFAKREEPQEEAPSGIGSAVRGFLHNVIPTGVGVISGVAATPFVGPVGGFGVGMATSAGASYLQEKAIEAVAPEEAKAYAKAQEEHPYSTLGGGVLSGGLYGTVRGGANLATRALMGGVGAGIDTAQQLALEHKFDPGKALIAGAGMAAFGGKPTRLGARLGLPDEAPVAGRAGGTKPAEPVEAVTGEAGSAAGPEAAAGIAQEAKPPADEAVSPDPLKQGQQDSAVIGSTGLPETVGGLPGAGQRDYGKKAPSAAEGASGGGVSVGHLDPTLGSAFQAHNEAAAASPLARMSDVDLRAAERQALDRFNQVGVQAADARTSPEVAQAKTELEGIRKELLDRRARAQQAPGAAPIVPDVVPPTAQAAAPRESVSDLLRRRAALNETSSPAEFRDLANRFRGVGMEAPARHLELGADTIEQIQRRPPPAEAQPVMQQAQQEQPPAAEVPTAQPTAATAAGAGPQAAPAAPPGAVEQVRGGLKTIADAIKAKFAPQTLSDQARAFWQGVNQANGLANQAHQRAMNEVMPHRNLFRDMSPEEGDAFIKNYQTGKQQPTQELQDADAALRRAFAIHAEHTGTLDRAQGIDWLENYLPGMYKNRQQAEQLAKDFTGKGMSGAGSLEKKTYQSYAEAAEKAGLEPLTRNPFEMLELYGNSMRLFTAKQAAIEHGLANGTIIKSQAPERVGAAGSKEPLIKTDLPPGYVQSDVMPGHFMPWEVKQVFDNSFGTHKYKNITDALKNVNSAWTNFELGLNGYHGFTMANEGLITQTGIAMEKLAGGDVPGALREAAKVPTAPVAYAKRGSEVQQAFLEGQSSQSPVAKITNELVNAGFNPIGRQHAQDVAMAQKTFFDSLQNMPEQIRRAMQDVGKDLKEPLSKGDMLQLGASVWKNVQRIIATTAHPLFDVYIPKLKAGAAYEQMRHWHEMNPDATPEQITAQANKVVSSIDNRFGEMHTDRLAMDGLVKDASMSMLRATSWLIGSMKEIGGGTYTIGRGAARAAIERDPARLNVFNPASEHYDPRATYVVAMFANLAMMSTAYQYLFGAGEAPKDWRDIYAPRTGGTAKGAPEHMLMPGYHKDIYGWLAHPGTEMYNKLSGVWQTAIEEARGRETPALGSKPFVDPRDTFLQNVGERLKYLGSKLGPISLKNLIYGQEHTSKIPLPMAAIGFRATGKAISAPEQMEKMETKQQLQEYKQRQKRIQREYSSRNYAQGGVVEQPRTLRGPRTFVNPKYQKGGAVKEGFDPHHSTISKNPLGYPDFAMYPERLPEYQSSNVENRLGEPPVGGETFGEKLRDAQWNLFYSDPSLRYYPRWSTPWLGPSGKMSKDLGYEEVGKYARGGSVVRTPSYKPQWRMAPFPAFGRMSQPFKPDKPAPGVKLPKQPKPAAFRPQPSWAMPET